MKIKIIKNVIVTGEMLSPGSVDKPNIKDLEPEMAERLIKIGCAVDPTVADMDARRDPAEVIVEMQAEIDGYVQALADFDKTIDAQAKKIASQEAQIVEMKKAQKKPNAGKK